MRVRKALLTTVVLVAAGAGAIALAWPADKPPAASKAPSRRVVVAKRVLPANSQPGRSHPTHPQPAHPRASTGPASSSPPASASRCTTPPPPVERQITHRQWLNGVVITEYYPAPERWFVGRRIPTPGLAGLHHADWLYSARGLAMEGDGVDLQDRPAHIAELGSTGWVNAAGRPTLPVCLGKWSDGFPAWLRGGWRNAHGAVTFPLDSGGWSNGRGVRMLDYGGVTFAPGNPQPLRYYHSIAVDPKLIPEGSRVYIPAYRGISSGWFVAQDTGGAIRGRHIDVYRPAPGTPADLGRYMTRQRILVIPPA
jgi:3D (Asp-Asp-Asp) domain-containing protein